MQEIILFFQHHLGLSLAFVVLFTLSIIVEFLRQKRAAQMLTPTQVTQMMNHEHAVVLDLRPADLFAKGHILGAQSLPQTDFQEKTKKIEKMKNKPLVLVCAKGHDSPKFAALLQKQGYRVHILGGGINAWTSADLPLVKE